MADRDTIIKLGLDADLTGGVQTEKQLEKVRQQAKKLEQDSKSGGASIEQAFGKATRAVGFFRKALAGFGVFTALTGLVEVIEKIGDLFSSAKDKAVGFGGAIDQAVQKNAAENLAKSYEQLSAAIQKAADATKHANEMQDIAVKNARELEDAQMSLAEQKELAAVDDSDPAAAERRAIISARYAAKRGVLDTSRMREDIDAQRNRLSSDAGSKRAAADRIMSSLSNDDALIKKTEGLIKDAETKAMRRNRFDLPKNSIRGMLKNLYTIDPLVDPYQTEEGNAERKRYQDMADRLKKKLEELKKDKKDKKEQAEKLRTEAAQLDERAALIYQAQETIDVKETTARVTGQRGMEDAETSLEEKNKEIAKKKEKAAADAATIAQGPGRIAALEKQVDAKNAQLLAAQQANANEQMDVVRAQNALDSFNNSGHRRNGTGVQAQRRNLEANLELQTREAAKSQADFDSLLATLSVEIKGLRSKIEKAKREIEAATKRQAAVNDNAPGG